MGRWPVRFVVAAMLAGASPAAGQDAGGGAWTAHVNATFERVDGSDVRGSDWIETRGGVGRRLAGGNIILEGMRTRRFAEWDVAGAAEIHHRLWPGAYGNVRGQFAPDPDVLPAADVSAELFQSIGQGFEVSLGYRRMEFDSSGVNVRRIGLARYIPGWYVRGFVSVVPHGRDTTATLLGAAVRRYVGDDLTYLELAGAFGTELVTVAAGPVVALRDTYSILLRGQHPLSRRLRATAGVSYAAQQDFPDRLGASLGLRIE